MKDKIVIANRIPHDYYVVSGFGTSDVDYHTGSFHLALQDAGIETANIMKYSSVIPPTAVCHEGAPNIKFGEVMECIIAECTGLRGEWCYSGILWAELYNPAIGETLGSIVVERSLVVRHVDPEDVCHMVTNQNKLVNSLNASLQGLFDKYEKDGFELRNPKYVTNKGRVDKKYGTVLCALCFTSYIIERI